MINLESLEPAPDGASSRPKLIISGYGHDQVEVQIESADGKTVSPLARIGAYVLHSALMTIVGHDREGYSELLKWERSHPATKKENSDG